MMLCTAAVTTSGCNEDLNLWGTYLLLVKVCTSLHPFTPVGGLVTTISLCFWEQLGSLVKFLDLRRKEDAVPDIFTVFLYLKTVVYRGKFCKEDGLREEDKGFLSAIWLQEGLGAMCSMGRGLQSRTCCWPSRST